MIDDSSELEKDAKDRNQVQHSLNEYFENSGPTGLAYFMSEIDPDNFEESLRGVITRYPEEPTLRVIYAKHLIETGRPAAAIEQLRKALKKDDSLVEARLFLIQSLATIAQYELAEKHCEAYLNREPEDPYGNLYMGMIGERLLHPDDSKYLQKAVDLALEEDYTDEVFENFASFAGAVGFSDHEQWLYRKWAEAQPENSDPLNQLALILESYGNLDECVSLYTKSLELEPQNPWTYLSLAEVYHSKGENENAREVCNKCLELISEEASEENWVALKEISSFMKKLK
ncbi:MAG: tetratricopeptide repeat protein [Methanomassiliicoccales archaeon]|nr:MAG: tetratricopeptide repeat protein [Methanomassiliicoccales archaeon]